MLQRAAILLACLAEASFAQAPPDALYRDLERLYSEVIGASLGNGGLCRGRTAAVEQRQRELAEALGNATAATGERVLLFAVTANSFVDVVRLDEAGAARTGDNGSLLHAAARFADPPLLEYLVSIGFGVEERGGAGGPALFVAVTENRRDNVEWLIEHGADVNATDRGGGTVVRHALVCRSQELVDELLEAGAVADQKSLELAADFGLVLRKR